MPTYHPSFSCQVLSYSRSNIMGVFHFLNVLILTVWCHEKNCLMLQQMNKLFQISNFLPSPLCVQCGLTCATLASLIV